MTEIYLDTAALERYLSDPDLRKAFIDALKGEYSKVSLQILTGRIYSLEEIVSKQSYLRGLLFLVKYAEEVENERRAQGTS